MVCNIITIRSFSTSNDIIKRSSKIKLKYGKIMICWGTMLMLQLKYLGKGDIHKSLKGKGK